MIELRRIIRTTDPKNSLYPDSKKNIGSRFTKSGAIHHGLTKEEVNTILPSILGVSRNDVTFMTVLNEYYAGLSVRVPHEGLSLNIDMVEGEPVEPLDYIKYKFVIGHPKLAMSKEIMKPYHEFYINDTEKEKTKIKEASDTRIEGYRVLLGLKPKNRKLLSVLLSIENTDKAFEDYLITNPKQFIEAATDENLDTKSFIFEAVKYQFITNIGSTYIYNGEEVGDSLDKAVIYFKQPENSEKVVEIKAKIKNYTRNE